MIQHNLKLTLLLIILCLAKVGNTQDLYTISGLISDSVSQESLIGANIQIVNTNIGTVSDNNGLFTLQTSPGKLALSISYVGYSPVIKEIDLQRDLSITIRLQSSSIFGNEIIVTANNPRDNIESIETGTIQLNMKDLKKLPSLMGEPDIIRVFQLTPGVQSGSDADMGFYVRGGGADQNLILLDKIQVYNPSHVLGIFSVFNSDAIGRSTLIKSGIPANYGGRLSSIMDIQMRNGDINKFHVQGSTGLISSKILIEGPLIKNKLSFLLSGRRSYIDEILKPLLKPVFTGSTLFYNNTKYYFTDINGKLFFKPTSKDQISFSVYSGKDDYKLENLASNFENDMSWGNLHSSLIWKHRINGNRSLATTIGITEYDFNLTATQQGASILMNSNNKDYVFKAELLDIGLKGQKQKIGVEYIKHVFKPNNIDASTNGTDLDFGYNRTLNAQETSIFYTREFNSSERLRYSLGLRYTLYAHTGSYIKLTEDENGDIIDSVYYKDNEIIKLYHSPEPRASARYTINESSSLKASFTLTNQYIHMVSSSAVTLPTDVWLPSTETIKPQRSTHYSFGYFKNFANDTYSSSINIYYKKYYNQIELLYGLINNYQDNLFEESMVFGDGNSYGAELYLEKALGKITGWIGYTLSWTNRSFDEINDGNIYPAKYDRRHDINLVSTYSLSDKLILSASFILSSGNAFTLPEYKFIIDGNLINGYGEKNSFRMPVYHRLDISLNYTLKDTERFKSSLNLSVYNVYNRQNPFYIYFEITGNISEYNLSVEPKQISVLPIIPSLSWNFKF